VVTDANPEYIGSITIDKDLLARADIWAGEKVLIADVNNGSRFETYTVEGKPGSGMVCVNGAAARLVKPGDRLIIMAFELTDKPITPKIVLVNDKNQYVKTLESVSSD
jgi:aspartate 1-decarboxylase